MKNIRKIGFLLLAVLLLIPFADVDAQKRKRKKEEDKPKVVNSFLNVYGGGGYSSLMHKIDESNVAGGGAGMIGIGYLMKHKSNLNFNAGLEFMFLNSSTTMNPMNYDADYIYSDAILNNHNVKYHLQFNDFREQQNRISLNIPIMVGAQFDAIYFLAGIKAELGLMGNYSSKSNYTTFIDDDMLIDPLENIYSHGLGTYPAVGKDKLKFGLDLTASAELGLCLDKWMPEKAKEFGGGEARRNISYRFGLFVDYGFLNINKNTTTDILLKTPGTEVNGDKVIIPEKEIDQINLRSVFNSALAESNPVNSFVVGAKFSVLFQMDKAPKPKPKRKMRRPSSIREISYVPDPTYFYCYVSDFETNEPLAATVKVYNLDEKADTIFVGVADAETGFVEEQIDNAKYGLQVTYPGYIDYNDTLFFVVSDTLYVDLQPIKKNTVVILRNLLFDTDKTTIRNVSAPSLEEMYQLLASNPNMRIRITGHTDNVGSERYNKKLSEGRAKAVYDEMVKRGIDPSRMEWNGRGSKEPIESNKTAEGRAENRRVEFTILSE